MAANVPRPGPAKLPPNAGLDEWLEEAKQCHYLPERAMKELCEKVKEILMEGGTFATASQAREMRDGASVPLADHRGFSPFSFL